MFNPEDRIQTVAALRHFSLGHEDSLETPILVTDMGSLSCSQMQQLERLLFNANASALGQLKAIQLVQHLLAVAVILHLSRRSTKPLSISTHHSPHSVLIPTMRILVSTPTMRMDPESPPPPHCALPSVCLVGLALEWLLVSTLEWQHLYC